jgi:predicted secreted hydrolase
MQKFYSRGLKDHTEKPVKKSAWFFNPCVHKVLPFCLLTGILAPYFTFAQEGFARVITPWPWKFPRDHGRHDDFQTEWWYVTGNLQDAQGRRFGYQLTFFRRATRPEKVLRASAWSFRDVYVSHFAISDVSQKSFHYDQRLARGALGIAGAAADSLQAHLQSWSMIQEAGALRLIASSDFGAINFSLQNLLPPALHGKSGLAKKGEQPGQASYYYSLPHLPTSGTLSIGKENFSVTGVSWMDHEFGSDHLTPGVVGWDWFALHLPDSVEVMIYLLRRGDGSFAPYSAGSLMRAGRVVRQLAFSDFACIPAKWWTSPRTGARYPIEWKIELGDDHLRVRAAFENQELDTRRTTGVIYWEGYVTIAGERAGQPLKGLGYLEMTGYSPLAPLRF